MQQQLQVKVKHSSSARRKSFLPRKYISSKYLVKILSSVAIYCGNKIVGFQLPILSFEAIKQAL
jgi:hypothetical protein